MPRDPSGSYTLPSNSFNPAVDGTTIDPADWNATGADLATAMTDSLSRSGEGGMLDTLNMDNHPIINAIIDTSGPNTIQVGGVTISKGQYPGTTTNDAATAGNEGEYIESVVLSGSATSLATGTAKTITSISLPAGDWDVNGTIYYVIAASTTITLLYAAMSGTTNTQDSVPGKFAQQIFASFAPSSTMSLTLPPYRLSLAGTTSQFLVAQATFATSTMTAYGIIRARRVR